MKKLLCLVLAVMLSVSTFVLSGCFRRGDDDKQIDPNKTQLYVGNTYGAFRDEWFASVIEKFEAENPTIQVWIDNDTDSYTDKNLINRLGSARQDMYFVSAVTYDTYVKSGKLADLTELVTTPMNELYTKEDGTPLFEETYTIADNMNDTLADYYRTDDGKYYAIPFYDAVFGLVYDIDLFEAKKLYYRDGFEDNPNLEARFITNLSQTKSAGPDGKLGTTDDGLPATYSQFKDLWTVMKSRGVTPFIWNKHVNYRQRYLMSVWAGYEGKKNFDLNNSFNGEYTFTGDSTPTKITDANASELMRQRGHEYALQVSYDIIKDSKNYAEVSFYPSTTNTAAQDYYLNSSRKQEPIGMIMEANWWVNEANGTFVDMAAAYGDQYSQYNRRFGFMPVPKADDGSSSTDTTMLGVSAHSVIIVDEASTKKDIAKKFLAYCQTQAGLSAFTTATGVGRAYDYELTEEQYQSLTPFARSVWDIYRGENTNFVYNTIFTSDYKKANSSNYTFWGFQADIGGANYIESFDAFYANPSLTMQDYLNGTLAWARGYDKK